MGVGFSLSYAARPNDPPFQRRTWKRANPGLDHFPDLEVVIRQEAKAATLDETALQSFRALRLNMGVPDTLASVLLEAAAWQRAEALPAPDRRSREYILGMDYSSS